MTVHQPDVDVVTRTLLAVERRQAEALMTLYHPRIEFHWPPGLPYSGTFKGRQVQEMSRLFAEVWEPLQPTEETRRLDFCIVATGDEGRVVARYTWKALAPGGQRFETPTLAEYRVRDGRLASATMY
ncbi:MAG: nuclear transport factor 2 family protein, partial [Propionivibrio sp.]